MKGQSVDLAVIMPVYNEAGIIRSVVDKWITELRRLNIGFEFHVYNDGSRDESLIILERMIPVYPELILHDKVNSGHGPTILQGYLENLSKEWLFQVDSDDEMSPEYFKILWEKRENHDFLLGKRINRKSPIPRKIISFLSRGTVRVLYGHGVHDVNSPFRLMRSKAIKEEILRIDTNTFAPNVVISGIASKKNLRIFETPVPYKLRTTGEVSIKKWKLLKAALKSCKQTILFRAKIKQ